MVAIIGDIRWLFRYGRRVQTKTPNQRATKLSPFQAGLIKWISKYAVSATLPTIDQLFNLFWRVKLKMSSPPLTNTIWERMIKNKLYAVIIPALVVHAIWWPYIGIENSSQSESSIWLIICLFQRWRIHGLCLTKIILWRWRWRLGRLLRARRRKGVERSHIPSWPCGVRLIHKLVSDQKGQKVLNYIHF